MFNVVVALMSVGMLYVYVVCVLKLFDVVVVALMSVGMLYVYVCMCVIRCCSLMTML